MKGHILNNSINLIKNHYPNYSDTELKTIYYGLEGIYITITKTIIIFGIAIILNIVNQLLMIVLIYNILRMFSFGLHANNSLSCLIASTLLFIGAAYFSTIIIIHKIIKIIVAVLCTLIFFKYSPADTAKRPIINKKRRSKYKVTSTFIIITYSFLLVLTKHNFISNALLISMIMQSFLISPFCYTLFRQPYNNFLNREGGI